MNRYKRAILKFLPHLKKYGFRKTVKRSINVLKDVLLEPKIYRKRKLTKAIKEEILKFEQQPKISVILPIYNIDPKWLDLAISSVRNQWYKNWEICLVDDASTKSATLEYLNKIDDKKIKIKRLPKNLHISGASNEAVKMATGEYLALLDHDDELSVDALYENVKAINQHGAEFIYSDEAILNRKGKLINPHYKPDFSYELIHSQNYICHLSVMKKSLFDMVGGFELGVEGSQDHDLFLKVLKNTDKVYHIAKILYFLRIIPGSTLHDSNSKSCAQEVGRKAVENAIKREGVEGEVVNGLVAGTYRVKYGIKGQPLISVIIPFKDKSEILKKCIESVLDKSTYGNFEIIGMSNNSEEKETFAEMEKLASLDKRISFYEYNTPFNYSEINNYAVNHYAKGEYLVLLNNDIEIITEEWLENMLMFAQIDKVGAVGAKLSFPDDRIQHAGVIIGICRVAGHSHVAFSREEHGYFSRLVINQNLSAVTGACLMVAKQKYQEMGGLDEENLKVDYNDVDFCLRLRERGYRNVFTPYAEAYHYESLTRGPAESAEARNRLERENRFMEKRHAKILQEGDPYYNPRLSLKREDFSLRRKKDYPSSRLKKETT